MTTKPVKRIPDLRQHPAHSVEEWLAEVYRGRGRTSLKDATKAYNAWCQARGINPLPWRLMQAQIKPVAPPFVSYGNRTFFPISIA